MCDNPVTMVAVAAPRIEGAIQLAGGRRLGFAEFGPPDGWPVLWFHGTPGARRQVPPPAQDAARDLGVRLIALERPGVGASTPHLYRAVLDWADDVREVIDRLGLGSIGLVGLSGGGPYVLACAHRMPERVVAGSVLGGVAPTRGPDAAPGGVVALAARFAPLLNLTRGPMARGLWLAARAAAPVSGAVIGTYARLAPEGDRRVLHDPAFAAMFVDDLVRGSRRRFSAPVSDLVLFTRPWGFSVRDVEVPIHFWYGATDNIVPPAHGEHLAELVPDSTLSISHDESHLSGFAAGRQVVEALVAHRPIAGVPPVASVTRIPASSSSRTSSPTSSGSSRSQRPGDPMSESAIRAT